jgi:serine/threonine protein kinase
VTDDADERATQRVGSVLNDKWTLEKLIGIGGMAAVYAGLHRNGARAAIKVLHPEYARRSEVKERFLREGYAANRVNHSGVVKVLDDDEIVGGLDDGGAFLVMELLEGQSLEDRVERGPPMEERELLPITAAVLDVLEAAHKAGVIHRDLKPENLFLARDPENPDAPPRIKILDFGLARIAEGTSKTMAGMAIGTPSYMPPEQAAGRVQDIDGRSDLFALGASCFRILSGRTVHPGDTALGICARMASEPAPKLRSVAPQVSAATAAAVDRALAFRRDDRWPDAASMHRAIDAAISELGGDVMQIESGMIEVVQGSEPEREPPPLPRAPKKRSSLLVWIALLAVVAAGVTIGIDKLGLRSLLGNGVTEDSGSDVATATVTVTATPLPVPDAFEPEQIAKPDATATELTDASGQPEEHDSAPDVTVDAPTETGASADAGRHRHHDAGTHHPHVPHHK